MTPAAAPVEGDEPQQAEDRDGPVLQVGVVGLRSPVAVVVRKRKRAARLRRSRNGDAAGAQRPAKAMSCAAVSIRPSWSGLMTCP
jgi:hypothetical protein